MFFKLTYLPRQEENNTPVRSRRIKQTHVCRAIVIRQHNVDTSRWSAYFAHRFLIHFSNGIGEGPSCINNALGSNIPFSTSNLVTHTGARDLFLVFTIFTFCKTYLIDFKKVSQIRVTKISWKHLPLSRDSQQ